MLLVSLVRTVLYRYHCNVDGGLDTTWTCNVDVLPLWMIVSSLSCVDVKIGATENREQEILQGTNGGGRMRMVSFLIRIAFLNYFVISSVRFS